MWTMKHQLSAATPATSAVVVLVTALVAVGLWGPSAAADGPGADEHHLAVRVAPGTDVDGLADEHHATHRRPLVADHDLWVFGFDHEDTFEDAVDDLEDHDEVRWVEVHAAANAPTASHRSWAWPADDPRTDGFAASWRSSDATDRIGVERAHRSTRGEGTTVAILDTEVDTGHVAFEDAGFIPGFDLIDDGAPTTSSGPPAGRAVGHGTHVAGLVHLVAPRADILPIRVLDDEGDGSLATLILGVELAVESGADVINVSLGTDAESEVLEDLLEDAEDAGVVTVAAVGNRGDDVEEYPARFDEALAVAAVDDTDTAAPFTSDGDWIDVAAPGVDLLGPHVGDAWARWSGTSMAAPLVAGQAALLRSLDRDRSAEDVVDLIDESVVEVTRTGSAIGEGRIDIAASIDLLLEE